VNVKMMSVQCIFFATYSRMIWNCLFYVENASSIMNCHVSRWQVLYLSMWMDLANTSQVILCLSIIIFVINMYFDSHAYHYVLHNRGLNLEKIPGLLDACLRAVVVTKCQLLSFWSFHTKLNNLAIQAASGHQCFKSSVTCTM